MGASKHQRHRSDPGHEKHAELREDIAVMGMPFQYVDERILQRYSAAIEPNYCTLCGHCEGTCPQRVEISTINRSLMYAEGYKSPELARATYREAAVSASACLDCFGLHCTMRSRPEYRCQDGASKDDAGVKNTTLKHPGHWLNCYENC